MSARRGTRIAASATRRHRAIRSFATLVLLSASVSAAGQDLIASIPGTQANSGGVRCRILGDATGDGVAEVIYSSANASTSYGSSTGLVRVFRGTTFQLLQAIEGTVPWAHFGIPAEGLGDVDGDGLSEMLVGAPDLVGPAPSAGVGELRVISVANNTVLWTSFPAWPSQRMSAAAIGDIDADGIVDVASGISLSTTVRRVSVQSGVDGHELLSISGSGFLDGESFGTSVGGTGDVDGDGVSNWLDKYDGLNDHKFDVDHDGIIDAYDTFYGNNNGDADGDGRANGLDLQPYAAPPRGQTQTPIPSTVTKKELTDAILRQQIARQAWRDMPDGIIDSDDPNSDPMRTDRDGDHEYDYWDPEPTNGYIDSRNDPYDPRNDEYWERD